MPEALANTVPTLYQREIMGRPMPRGELKANKLGEPQTELRGPEIVGKHPLAR
jgi:hypothetical protein